MEHITQYLIPAIETLYIIISTIIFITKQRHSHQQQTTLQNTLTDANDLLLVKSVVENACNQTENIFKTIHVTSLTKKQYAIGLVLQALSATNTKPNIETIATFIDDYITNINAISKGDFNNGTQTK